MTWPECHQAAFIAVNRQLTSMSRGSRHRYGADPFNHWTIAIEGCGAELAVAKYLDRYWAARSTLDYDGDVGQEQVRQTAHEHGRLIVHREDNGNARFWLVTGMMPRYTIRGWIRGAEAEEHVVLG